MRVRLLLPLACLLLAATVGNAAELPSPSFAPVGLASLPGFAQDDHRAALQAFVHSCAGAPPQPAAASSLPPFSADDWQHACAAARQVAPENTAAQAFFTTHFTPYRLETPGHFTGYYVPVLRGSLTQGGAFVHPVYRMPPELANGSAAQPFFDRAAIDRGALAGRGLELLWCDDPVMLFFAHVQGSATLSLPDGSLRRLAFAGKNGLPYHAIGKTLVERGALRKDAVSLQTIRDWLYAHPTDAAGVLHTNPSYIFFTLDTQAGPVRGAHGTALSDGRSLAVDPAYAPLGLPLFIDTTLKGQPFRRIALAQDTGSAIKGPGRVDIFFGYGAAAEALAGDMNASGAVYVLLPRRGGHG